jgi:hypothetical protein
MESDLIYFNFSDFFENLWALWHKLIFFYYFAEFFEKSLALLSTTPKIWITRIWN